MHFVLSSIRRFDVNCLKSNVTMVNSYLVSFNEIVVFHMVLYMNGPN
jgi:hypothetical protein